MAELKHDHYILRGKPGKPAGAEKASVIEAELEGPSGWSGIQHRLDWKYVSGPTVLMEKASSYAFDQFLVFLGGNPADPKDFKAEIEISLGEDGEKHQITSATIVCVPKGMVCGPVNFNKVEKPVLFAVIYLSPEYSGKPIAAPGSSGTGSKYGKYVLTEPTSEEGPRKLDTEAWGVSINEKLTADIGKFDCNFNFLGILGPHVLVDPPHQHNCDEILFLVPASYDDWPNLGGEMEIAIGEEWEKQTINTAAVICLPPGVHHCPVFMKKVDKPFYWGHILRAPSYGSSAFNPE